MSYTVYIIIVTITLSFQYTKPIEEEEVAPPRPPPVPSTSPLVAHPPHVAHPVSHNLLVHVELPAETSDPFLRLMSNKRSELIQF